MITPIIYNNKTKQFAIPWNLISQGAGIIGNKFISSGNSAGVAAIAGHANAIGALASMAGGLSQLRSPIQTVVFKQSNGKVTSKSIRAKTGMDALNKIKAANPKASGFRAFGPGSDYDAQDYALKLQEG